MNILIVNGSPKPKDSTSAALIQALKNRLQREELEEHHALKEGLPAFLEKLSAADTLVVVFPLYVDALPSHLLRLLDEALPIIQALTHQVSVYALVHNGFFEPEQCRHAVSVIRHFSDSAGFVFRQGLALGAGPLAEVLGTESFLLRTFAAQLDVFVKHIVSSKKAPDQYMRPNFPRFLYNRLVHLNWKSRAKKNGLRGSDLHKKP